MPTLKKSEILSNFSMSICILVVEKSYRRDMRKSFVIVAHFFSKWPWPSLYLLQQILYRYKNILQNQKEAVEWLHFNRKIGRVTLRETTIVNKLQVKWKTKTNCFGVLKKTVLFKIKDFRSILLTLLFFPSLYIFRVVNKGVGMGLGEDVRVEGGPSSREK